MLGLSDGLHLGVPELAGAIELAGVGLHISIREAKIDRVGSETDEPFFAIVTWDFQ